MRGAFLAFEWEKAFRVCTCIGELDTGKKVPAKQILDFPPA